MKGSLLRWIHVLALSQLWLFKNIDLECVIKESQEASEEC